MILDTNKPTQRISEIKDVIMDVKHRFDELGKTNRLNE